MSGYSLSLTPMGYRGDPTIRGLAKLPTLFNANDLSQGAARDTAIAQNLVASAIPSPATPSFTLSIGGTSEPTPTASAPTTFAPSTPTTPQGGSASKNDCSQYPTASADWLKCMAFDYSTSPTDIVGGTITNWLNQGLFGLLALVLIGVGLFLFVKD